MDIARTLIELLIGYIVLFISTKILGKTQISQITPFDYISALVLGELVGNAVYQDDVGIIEILCGVFGWTFLIFITEISTQKSRRLRNLFEGRPSIIINKGLLDWKTLKKNHLDVDQLLQLLRTKDVFSLEDVEYAILENNGTISVLKKDSVSSLTRQDFNLPPQDVTLPVILISDGQVRWDILTQYGLNDTWLFKKLQQHGAKKPTEVRYAELKDSNELYIQKYKA